MNRPLLFSIAIFLVGLGISLATAAGPAATAEHDWHLMLPGGIIDQISREARFQPGVPVERQIVLICDRPWEGNYSGDCVVIKEPHNRSTTKTSVPDVPFSSPSFRHVPSAGSTAINDRQPRLLSLS